MLDPEWVVRALDLKKYFGKVRAVESMSLHIPRGQIYALLGPNGAGKTTALRMLLGLCRPHGGTLELLGGSLAKERARILQRVGALVEAPSCYPHLTGRQNLELTGGVLGVERADIERVLELVSLTQAADRKAKTYSLGMRGRLALAIALLGKPELLILDEPLNGLDPEGIRDMRALIRDLPAQGVTVLLSSHQLGEVEQVATHVGIVRAGRTLFEGSMDELHAATAPRLRLRVDRVQEAQELLQPLGSRCDLEREQLVLTSPTEAPEEINRRLVQAGIGVRGLDAQRPSLEELFFELTGGEEVSQ